MAAEDVRRFVACAGDAEFYVCGPGPFMDIVEGAATMHLNNALTEDEVAEGWVLTCQAVPTTASVHVVYE